MPALNQGSRQILVDGAPSFSLIECVFSKAQVIAQIQKLHRVGRPLNITAVKRWWPKLIESVYARKKYWGWKQALKDAGIAYDEIVIELEKYEECRLCGERFRHVGSHLYKGHDVTSEEYLAEFPDAELTSEAFRTQFVKPQKRGEFFLPQWEPIWTAEYVLDRIHAHHLQGAPLNVNCCLSYDPALYTQAVKYLGSWDRALERVGVSPFEARRHRDRSVYHCPEGVVAEIRRRYRAGWPLNTFALVSTKDTSLRDQSLLKWGREHYGSWPAAVKAAGVDPKAVTYQPKTAVYRSKAAVKREIKRRHREGLPLNHHAVAKGEPSERDAALVKAALRLYGNWDNALAGAGLSREAVTPPRKPKQIKYPAVYREVEKVKQKLPQIVKLSGYQRYEAMMELHRKHYWAVRRSKYDSWKGLADAMGLPFEAFSLKRYGNEELVFDALRERIRQKKSNRAGDVFHDDRPLYDGVLKHFGNFRHPKLRPYLG